MENKTYYGGVVGWILGGSFIVLGILNFIFVPAAIQRSPAWLMTAAGLVLIFLFQTRVRFGQTGFSVRGPFFIPRRVEYSEIIQFHFEYRDRRFPEVPTSVQYQLISGKWERFESGLFSARVQKLIAEEFRNRIHLSEKKLDFSRIGMERMLSGLRWAHKAELISFLFAAIFCILIGFRYWIFLLPGIGFLMAFLSRLRSRDCLLDRTETFLKTFSAEVLQHYYRTAHERIRPVMQAAGKICGPFTQRNGRFSAFYPKRLFRKFVVFDMREKRFFYCRFFRENEKSAAKYIRYSIPFSEVDFLAVGQIAKSFSAGIAVVTKDGCCYGLGIVSGRHLQSLDDVVMSLTETLGKIPVIFL